MGIFFRTYTGVPFRTGVGGDLAEESAFMAPMVAFGGESVRLYFRKRRNNVSKDPGYGRGVPFWAFSFSGQGSLVRVTPLFLCDFTYSSCFTLTKSIRNAKVI